MTWAYRPGDWFGIFGENAVVVLPPTEKSRVAPVWELVDDGAGFDVTLDALISSGLRDLPGFVLVSRDGDETRVVLRGEAHAHFATADDVVHVDGEEATTWVERSLTGVQRVRIAVADEDLPDDLCVAGGLVRIASAEWGSEPSGPGPATEAMAVPGPGHDSDHDGLTQRGTETPGRVLPGIPGQEPAPAVMARPVARLVFSSGEVVDVDRAVVVGRAPTAGAGDGESGAGPGAEPRLVAVASPHQEISSTHLEIRPGSGADHGSAVVTDLGSTNGTLLVQPGLPAEDLRAGVAVALVPGAVIDLGDGVSIRVVTP